jgi:hypothetical protein
MNIPTDNRDRQNQALTFLRGSLSRCEQEGCDIVDVIRTFYAWSLRQRKPKKLRFIRLGHKSSLPEIGASVRVEKESKTVFEERPGDIGIVTEHFRDFGVRVLFPANGEDLCTYGLDELSLVVEE